ncbi:MAG: TIGR00730 family Rossman fold protein [Rhizobiaceae bacterium]|nr:TIGR00730 family Rossman fold protein [Rhizobiaceae bacterium]
MNFMSSIQSVCVYCGSSPGSSEIYPEAARTLGRAIAESGLTLVYGAGTRGIMGAVAEGAAQAGGKITGIIPRFLIRKEADGVKPPNLDEFIVTEDMHARKHTMYEKSDSFVAMPGGIGTLEEVIEIMTWAQLGRHKKPIILANISGFWNPLLALLNHMSAEGFLHSGHLVRPIVVDQAADIVPAILAAASQAGSNGADEEVISKL